MGLKGILGITKARDKPRNDVGDVTYTFMFGQTTNGKPANERIAKYKGNTDLENKMTGLKINTMVIILPIRIKCEWGECNAKEKITMVS